MHRAGIVLAVVALLQFLAGTAAAALPPFELVQKSVAQGRTQESITLDLRVTETSGKLDEWDLRGVYQMGDRPKRLSTDNPALQLLWIATLSLDPVAEIQRSYGFVNGNVSTVGVQEGFVYVYGTLPAVSVYRDLKRLAAFSLTIDGERWVTRMTWNEDHLTGLMITRGGRTE